MTKLIVEPVDLNAAGSFKLRDQWLSAYMQMSEAKKASEYARGYVMLRDLAVARMSTDDGTPVEEALADVSAAQFDALLMQLFGGETVDPTKSGS